MAEAIDGNRVMGPVEDRKQPPLDAYRPFCRSYPELSILVARLASEDEDPLSGPERVYHPSDDLGGHNLCHRGHIIPGKAGEVSVGHPVSEIAAGKVSSLHELIMSFDQQAFCLCENLFDVGA